MWRNFAVDDEMLLATDELVKNKQSEIVERKKDWKERKGKFYIRSSVAEDKSQ
jgi:hypothetical protein